MKTRRILPSDPAVRRVLRWAKILGNGAHRVARTRLGHLGEVSTVIVPHFNDLGRCYETMIFGSSLNGYQRRCDDPRQVTGQHQLAVRQLRRSLGIVGLILKPSHHRYANPPQLSVLPHAQRKARNRAHR